MRMLSLKKVSSHHLSDIREEDEDISTDKIEFLDVFVRR